MIVFDLPPGTVILGLDGKLTKLTLVTLKDGRQKMVHRRIGKRNKALKIDYGKRGGQSNVNA